MADSRYAGEAGLQAVFGQIKAAMAEKQDKINDMGLSHNDYSDTEKAQVATNANDISLLKSGLTNYENQNNLNLEVPNRKNLVKVTEPSVVWQGVTFVNNNDGTITSTGSNTGNNPIAFIIGTVSLVNGEKYTFTGCPSNGGASSYRIDLRSSGTVYDNIIDEGSGYSFTARQNATVDVCIRIAGNYSIPEGGLTFSPMIRLASVSDPTFAPYIPSVESRIEAVEKGNVSHEILKSSTSVWSGDTLTFTVAPENGRMWRLVAGVSYALGTKFVEAYIVIRSGKSGVFVYNAHGTVTATYDYTTGVLTVTLPESSHWIYRMELAAAYYD